MYKIIYKKYFNEHIAKGKLMSKYLYPKGIIRKTVIKQNTCINTVDLHGKLETLVKNENTIFIKDKESYARSVNLDAVILENKRNKKIKIGTLIHTNFCFNEYLNLTKYYTSLSFIKRWKKNTFSSNLKKRNIFIISPNSGGFIIAYWGIIGFIPRTHILPLKLKTEIEFDSSKSEAQEQDVAYKWQIVFNKYKSQFFNLKLTATLQPKKDDEEEFKQRLLRRRKIKVSFVFTNPHCLKRKKKKEKNRTSKW